MPKSSKQAKRDKLEASAPPAAAEKSSPSKTDQIMKMPMTNYLSTVGLHSSLLVFSAIYLPQSTLLRELPFSYESGYVASANPSPLEALTARPTVTMLLLCLGTLLLQLWWAIWLRNWWIDSMLDGNEEVKKKAKRLFTGARMKALVRVFVALAVASLVAHALLVLFGAPFIKHVGRTYLLAFLIAALTALPPVYLYGPPSFSDDSSSLYKRWTFVRLFAELSPRNPIERALAYPPVGTVVGAWIGIIPIALDWDRPWQAWPLTPAFGAIVGYILASAVALVVNAMELVNAQTD